MMNKNPSEWRVSANPVAGRTFYGVYRLRDVNATDHSGNREARRGLFETRDEAKRLADMLNEEATE